MPAILVVDDHALNREFLTTLLGYYGHALTEAADGREGLVQVRAHRPDLIITDIMMPNMDGEEFARQLSLDPATKNIPVIFYTATYRLKDARAMGARVGVTRVLGKPCEPGVIVEMVDDALGSRPAEPAPPDMAIRDVPVHGLAQRIASVQDLNLRLAGLLDNARALAHEQASTIQTVRELESALMEAQSFGLRITGLVELSHNLAVERDPATLPKLFCKAVQNILNARFAAVVLVPTSGDTHCYFSALGMDDAVCANIGRDIPCCGLEEKVLAKRHPIRIDAGAGDGGNTGLPAAHPPVRAVLAYRITALGWTCGWMYVADRIDGSDFTRDDERIIATLSAQAATAWESTIQYQDLEQRVAARTAELNSANRELESFSYSVSHDLRAPLRAIRGYGEMLVRDHADAMPAAAGELVGKIRKNADDMTALVNDLLEFSRLGRAALNVREVDLAHLVSECLAALKGEQSGRDIAFCVGTLPACRGDPMLLKQALMNLLSNAIKYTARTEHPRIDVTAEAHNGEVIIHVRDNGVGFDMKHAERLFEVFQRLHAKSEFEGTGVGLAIVKRVVERHGGRVWAEAEPDKGAAFHFSVPSKRADAAGAHT